jgi:hypothetical protein
MVLGFGGDRRLFSGTMTTMMPLRLRNAMSAIMFTKMEKNWPMNPLKIKDVPSVIPKKATATGPDCAGHFI